MSILTLCLLCVSTIHASDLFHEGSVYCEGYSCKFVENVLDFKKASAVGTFNDTLMITGWGILDVVAGTATTGPKQTDAEIMFAAGFLEGVFTAEQMEKQFTNTFADFFPKPDPDLKAKLNDWFLKQRKWAENMIKQHREEPFWQHVSYIFAQLDGLYKGYKSIRGGSKNPLNMFAINFLNSNGDIEDILRVLRSEFKIKTVRHNNLAAEIAEDIDDGHCSALIKLLPGLENIFMSHATWSYYADTNRIYKHYNFNVKDKRTTAQKLSFSSYPGVISSIDDFYLLGSGLAVLETTNPVYNKTLFKLVKPQALLAWQRVRVASMMANNGKEWTQVVARYNSGTYNNQYMVLDLNLVTLKQPLPDNTLWVAEQIPGLVVSQDLTHVLQFGYFPSYNVPYFEEIYNKSGYPAHVKTHGNAHSYQMSPRAEIFRRDQGKVDNIASMKRLMRSNDYKHDPYSQGNPRWAICARRDLAGKPVGCYDAKVSDLQMAKRLEADIISGPTLGTHLPPFTWANFNKTVHVGLPETYNFPFITTKPRFG